jgi:hypothetical protein
MTDEEEARMTVLARRLIATVADEHDKRAVVVAATTLLTYAIGEAADSDEDLRRKIVETAIRNLREMTVTVTRDDKPRRTS